jgi:hypothetical protein
MYMQYLYAAQTHLTVMSIYSHNRPDNTEICQQLLSTSVPYISKKKHFLGTQKKPTNKYAYTYTNFEGMVGILGKYIIFRATRRNF